MKMRPGVASRRIASLSIIAALGSLVACGGESSSVIVARVAGVGSISKAMVDHWIPVEAVVLYQENPLRPVPTGVIPDPPNFSSCIAYLAKRAQEANESGPKSTAELKGRCTHRYRDLKELTLNTLIGWDWTIAAGKTLGMKASDAEVKRRYTEVNKRSWPKAGEYARYLKLTGQTDADMMLRYRVQVYESKLLQKLEAIQKSLPATATAQQRQRAGAALSKYMSGPQWVPITSCIKGYVVSACKEYRGPEPPGIPN
jgi:hypothetical protein